MANRNRTFLTTDKNNLIKENFDGFLFSTLDILDQRKIEFQKPDEFNQYNIFKNISKNKTAQQSSFHPDYSQYNDASAILNPNVYFQDYSIFTDWEENPWWMIDLEYEYEISLVKIQNKEWATWQDRLTKLEVLYSNDLKTWEKIDKKYFEWKNGIQILNIWTLNLIKARFIKLQIPELSCLHIKEIDIYTIDTIILNAIKK